MNVYYWHGEMRHAPTLRHDNGLVLVDLDGKSVLFPSEADARFFHAAYTAVPALAGEVEILRKEIDEGALAVAQERVKELEGKLALTMRDMAALEIRHAAEVQRRTDATTRATVLAKALRSIREKL